MGKFLLFVVMLVVGLAFGWTALMKSGSGVPPGPAAAAVPEVVELNYPAGQVIELSSVREWEQLSASGRVLLVDFNADWCFPCKIVAPIVAKVAGQYGERLLVVSVDVDKFGEVSRPLGVRYLPHVAVFKGGEQIEQVSDTSSHRDIISTVDRHLPRPPPKPRVSDTIPSPTPGAAAPKQPGVFDEEL